MPILAILYSRAIPYPDTELEEIMREIICVEPPPVEPSPVEPSSVEPSSVEPSPVELSDTDTSHRPEAASAVDAVAEDAGDTGGSAPRGPTRAFHLRTIESAHVGDEHHAVRKRAHPYTIGEEGGQGGDETRARGRASLDLVVEARAEGGPASTAASASASGGASGADGELLGFIAMEGSTVVELAVDPPAAHSAHSVARGRGVAGVGAALMRRAAELRLARLVAAKPKGDVRRAEPRGTAVEARGEEVENGKGVHVEEGAHRGAQERITMRARWCDLNTRQVCLRLGYVEVRRVYPARYDWHGGVEMEASLEQVAVGRSMGRPGEGLANPFQSSILHIL